MNKNASASFGSWAKSVIIAAARRNQRGTKGKPEHGGGRNNSQKHVSHHLPVGLRTATVGTSWDYCPLFLSFPLSHKQQPHNELSLSLSLPLNIFKHYTGNSGRRNRKWLCTNARHCICVGTYTDTCPGIIKVQDLHTSQKLCSRAEISKF